MERHGFGQGRLCGPVVRVACWRWCCGDGHLGDKLFAVPWPRWRSTRQNKRFTLNVPKETLKDAPGFDRSLAVDVGQGHGQTGVHKFYGTPYAAE